MLFLSQNNAVYGRFRQSRMKKFLHRPTIVVDIKFFSLNLSGTPTTTSKNKINVEKYDRR